MPPLLARSRQPNQLLGKRLDGERKRTIDRRRGVIHDSPLRVVLESARFVQILQFGACRTK